MSVAPAALNSPRSVTSDEPIGGPCSIFISVTPSSPPVVQFCQSLRRRLLLSGVQCTVAQTTEVGGVLWRRQLIRSLQRTAVCLCVVTADWLRSGVSMLTLYYALRRCATCSAPTVIPILMEDVAECAHPLVRRMREQCFHIVHESGTVAVDALVGKLRNFLRSLQFDIPTHTVQDGHGLADIYAHHHAAMLGKPPRRTLLNLVRGLQDNAAVLDLAADVSTTPPTAHYVGDNGLRPLLEVVRMLPNLRRLGLRGNGLSNASVHPLVQTLLDHPSLRTLDLGENTDITQAAAPELYYLVRFNEQLTELRIDGTSIASAVWTKRLATQLERNKSSAFGEWAAIKEDNTEPLKVCDVPYVDLEKDKPVCWDVAFTCRPKESLMSPSLWTVENTTLSAVAEARAQSGVYKYTEKMTGAEKQEVLAYFQGVDHNTCCLKKLNGATIKLVLEQEGAGLEALQQRLRLRAATNEVWPAQLSAGLQKVTVRAVCEKPERCKESSFFVDAALFYAGERRAAKDTPQLFREDIVRYTGSVRHEVLALLERVYDDELVLDEERVALAGIEEDEERRLQQADEEEMERVVQYWRANTQAYKQPVDETLCSRIAERRRKKEELTDTEKNIYSDSFEVKLATLDTRYRKSCVLTTDYPPYNS